MLREKMEKIKETQKITGFFFYQYISQLQQTTIKKTLYVNFHFVQTLGVSLCARQTWSNPVEIFTLEAISKNTHRQTGQWFCSSMFVYFFNQIFYWSFFPFPSTGI